MRKRACPFQREIHAGLWESSHGATDQLIAGARVDVAPYKQDPADFVLWKPSD